MGGLTPEPTDVCGSKSCRNSGFSKFGATAHCEIPVGTRFHSIIYDNRVYTPQEFANEFNCEVKIGFNVFYPYASNSR